MSVKENSRAPLGDDGDRVIPVLDWFELIGVSEATGRRLIARKEVRVIQLSARRQGVRLRDHKTFLDQRTR